MMEEDAFIHIKLDDEHFTLGVDNKINFLMNREAFLKLYLEDKEKLLDLIMASVRGDIERKIDRVAETLKGDSE